MNTEEINKTLSNNRMRLYEVVSILQLIDHSEGHGCEANVYSAVHAVSCMVDEVALAIDELETSISREAQS